MIEFLARLRMKVLINKPFSAATAVLVLLPQAGTLLLAAGGRVRPDVVTGLKRGAREVGAAGGTHVPFGRWDDRDVHQHG